MNSLIEIRNLTTTFGSRIVHKNISIDFRKGELLLLMGGSGSGKSTLIEYIIDTDNSPCFDGKILWGGKAWNKLDIAYKVGFAPQLGGFLRDYTIGENIAMPLEYVAQFPRSLALEIAWANMQILGLPESAFGQYPHMLSGGMLRRASIARAMALNQEFLILDEPLSGLDPINCQLLIDLIRSLLPEKSIVCATHHFMQADRYAIMHDGSVILGTLDQVVKDPYGREFMHSFMK